MGGSGGEGDAAAMDSHPYSTGLGLDRPLHDDGDSDLLQKLHHVVRALKSAVMQSAPSVRHRDSIGSRNSIVGTE